MSFTTSKGTVLPILNLRGKDYLEVKYRLVWFREERANWSIETEFVKIESDSAMAKATIRDEEGRVIATSHKTENESGFPDFIEKAETGAIGRALALVGYGTQFCADELDEGERIVDAPADRPKASATMTDESTGALGSYRPTFGKYRGRRIAEIAIKDLDSYCSWLRSEADKKRTALSVEANIFIRTVEEFKSKKDAWEGTSQMGDIKA